MLVTDEDVLALRAFLTGDDVTFDRVSVVLEERDGGNEEFAALQGAAFAAVARRRFPDGHTAGDVVRLVAEARAAVDDTAGEIDPRTAEGLLHGVLCDPAAAGGLDEVAKARTQPALLQAMLEEADVSGAELDSLLAEARELADRWLAGPA
jgi:hypothetical protein